MLSSRVGIRDIVLVAFRYLYCVVRQRHIFFFYFYIKVIDSIIYYSVYVRHDYF